MHIWQRNIHLRSIAISEDLLLPLATLATPGSPLEFVTMSFLNLRNRRTPGRTVSKTADPGTESTSTQYPDSRRPIFLRTLARGKTSEDSGVEVYRDTEGHICISTDGSVKELPNPGPNYLIFDVSPAGDRVCIADSQALSLYSAENQQLLGSWETTQCGNKADLYSFSQEALIKDIAMINTKIVVLQIIDSKRWPGDIVFVSLEAKDLTESRIMPTARSTPENSQPLCSFRTVSIFPCQNIPSTRVLLPQNWDIVTIISKYRYIYPRNKVSRKIFEGPQQDTNLYDMTSWLTSESKCHGESLHGFAVNDLLDNPTRAFYLGGIDPLQKSHENLYTSIWKNEAQMLMWQPFSWVAAHYRQGEPISKDSMELDRTFDALTSSNAPSKQMADRIVSLQIEFAIRSYAPHGSGQRTLAAFPRFDPRTRRSVMDVWDLDQRARRTTLADRQKNFWIGTGRWGGFSPDLGILRVYSEVVGQEEDDSQEELWLIP